MQNVRTWIVKHKINVIFPSLNFSKPSTILNTPSFRVSIYNTPFSSQYPCVDSDLKIPTKCQAYLSTKMLCTQAKVPPLSPSPTLFPVSSNVSKGAKVGRDDKSEIFWPAGECVARPVACRPHCRCRDRLNPFKGVVMVKPGEGQKEEDPAKGTDFYDSTKRKKDEPCAPTRRVPCFRHLSRSRVLSISAFFLSLPPFSPLFSAFRTRDRWSTSIHEICSPLQMTAVIVACVCVPRGTNEFHL